MSVKFYMLYCEYCNWKKLTDGSDIKLVELITSPIPGGIPKINSETGKVEQPKSKKQPRKFKCPQCGRIVIPKRMNSVENSPNRIILDGGNE